MLRAKLGFKIVGSIVVRSFNNILEKDTLEVIGFILARPFYTMSEKETLEVVGSIMARSCGIGKNIARYILNKPCGVILALMSQLILIVAKPLDLRLVNLPYAVLSAVMS